jgi:HAD superfamily hydrolase (TIGR01484 family)
MRFFAFATDYDGTLAHDGFVAPSTILALERLRASGRRTLLVTGRELRDLQRIFPRLDLFDRVVAENGAVLYRPHGQRRGERGSGERAAMKAGPQNEVLLCEPPPAAFLAALRARNVPFSVGRAVVATWEPHHLAVLETIRRLGLELQVTFNKGAVMVLPTSVNKESGLLAALDELGLSPRNAVAVGDAENDHAFLGACECGVAVANALPMLKQRADLVLNGEHGAGVEELIDRLLAEDLASVQAHLRRRTLLLGRREEEDGPGGEVRIDSHRSRLLIAGPSGSGKTTAAAAVVERLVGMGLQCCIVDPEGDYEESPGLLHLGTADRAPSADEVLDLLAAPSAQVAVQLVALSLEERPRFLAALLPRLLELRARTGRPHWIVLDEAHHVLPAAFQPAAQLLPRDLFGVLAVTLKAEKLPPALRERFDCALAVGDSPADTLRPLTAAERFADAPSQLGEDEALAWFATDDRVFRLLLEPGRQSHKRHRRKYAAGDLRESAFWFRGPELKLQLRAHNLASFLELAEGVGDETWQHHRGRRDYSRWLREGVKDEELAAEAQRIEEGASSPAESRQQLRAAIERRYTFAP